MTIDQHQNSQSSFSKSLSEHPFLSLYIKMAIIGHTQNFGNFLGPLDIPHIFNSHYFLQMLHHGSRENYSTG